MLFSNILYTPVGAMIALADNKKLWALQFVEDGSLEQKLQVLGKQLQATITPQRNACLLYTSPSPRD